MNMKKRKRSLALALSTVMVLSTTTPVLAKNQSVEKEETVYVKTDASGSEKTIIVSDWLKNLGVNDSISDKSNLEDIENVKGKETFIKEKTDKLTWTANGNDIYYQGKINKSLPVSMKVTYYLNNKEIKPNDLIGKSGKVRIHYAYTNHSSQTRTIHGKETTIYTPFTMVTAGILGTDHFSNVKITNGKVISDGSKHIVMGVAMPGLSESLDLKNTSFGKKYQIPDSFDITADAKDFQMTVTATVATCDALSEFGFDDIGSVDDLTSSLTDLSDASARLSKGSGDLYKGITELATASKSLKAGTANLQKSTKDLENGLNTISNGSRQLKAGTSTLASKTKSLPKSMKKIDKGVKTILKSVRKEKPNSAAMNQLKQTLKDSQKEITTSMKDMASQVQSIGSLAQDPNANIGVAERQKLGAIAKSMQGDLETMESDLKIMSTCLNSINKQLDNALKSTKQLQRGLKTLSKGTSKLYKSSKTLKKSIKKVNNGAKNLNSGIGSASSGSTKLSKGATRIDEGTGKLVTGIEALQSGTKTLDEGMKEFDKTGITPLVSLINNDVNNIAKRAEAITQAGDDYQTFTKKSSTMDGSVKFVIETSELEK